MVTVDATVVRTTAMRSRAVGLDRAAAWRRGGGGWEERIAQISGYLAQGKWKHTDKAAVTVYGGAEERTRVRRCFFLTAEHRLDFAVRERNSAVADSERD